MLNTVYVARPGLKEFLEKISKMYELHIYTLGTKTYAHAIAKIVDPMQSLFHDRILSRDDSGGMTRGCQLYSFLKHIT